MAQELSFSERYGYKQICNEIQINGMSEELRTDLFNSVYRILLVFGTKFDRNHSGSIKESFYNSAYDSMWMRFFNSFYSNVLKLPLTKVPIKSDAWNAFEEYFFKSQWFEIYSLIEWFLRFFKDMDISAYFNNVLKDNCSGYRVIGKQIAPITDDYEIAEIEKALAQDKEVAVHLATALKLLSDRNTKDYRNSIKESISAVEKITRNITGANTLGDALKMLQRSGIIIPNVLHKDLKKYMHGPMERVVYGTL